MIYNVFFMFINFYENYKLMISKKVSQIKGDRFEQDFRKF